MVEGDSLAHAKTRVKLINITLVTPGNSKHMRVHQQFPASLIMIHYTTSLTSRELLERMQTTTRRFFGNFILYVYRQFQQGRFN